MNEYELAAKYLDATMVPDDFKFKENYDKTSYKLYSKSDYEKYRNAFVSKYGSDSLKRIPYAELYSKLFDQNNKSSMIYELRHYSNPSFGSLGDRDNIYPIYVKKGIYYSGPAVSDEFRFQQELTKDQVQKICGIYRTALVNAATYLNNNGLKMMADYEKFGMYLDNQTNNNASHGWLHKYLQILYPQYFTQFNNHKYRQILLAALRVNPASKWYATDAQLSMIREYMSNDDQVMLAWTIYNNNGIMKWLDGDTSKTKLENVIPIVPKYTGNYDNWIIDYDNTISTAYYPDFMKEPIVLNTPEAADFFTGRKNEITQNVIFVFDGEKYISSITKTDTGAVIGKEEEFAAALAEFIGENNGKVSLKFKSTSKSYYSVDVETIPELEIVVPEDENEQEEFTRGLTDEQLRHIAEKRQTYKPKISTTEVKHYSRDTIVAANAKREAKGICQLCKQPAPFTSKNGEPYLEVHHIVSLADGGPDTIDNTIALCPNCHRKIHIVNSQEDVAVLIAEKERARKVWI